MFLAQYLLIVPEGIEISSFSIVTVKSDTLLIVPEGIEIDILKANINVESSFNRTRRN